MIIFVLIIIIRILCYSVLFYFKHQRQLKLSNSGTVEMPKNNCFCFHFIQQRLEREKFTIATLQNKLSVESSSTAKRDRIKALNI